MIYSAQISCGGFVVIGIFREVRDLAFQKLILRTLKENAILSKSGRNCQRKDDISYISFILLFIFQVHLRFTVELCFGEHNIELSRPAESPTFSNPADEIR